MWLFHRRFFSPPRGPFPYFSHQAENVRSARFQRGGAPSLPRFLDGQFTGLGVHGTKRLVPALGRISDQPKKVLSRSGTSGFRSNSVPVISFPPTASSSGGMKGRPSKEPGTRALEKNQCGPTVLLITAGKVQRSGGPIFAIKNNSRGRTRFGQIGTRQNKNDAFQFSRLKKLGASVGHLASRWGQARIMKTGKRGPGRI